MGGVQAAGLHHGAGLRAYAVVRAAGLHLAPLYNPVVFITTGGNVMFLLCGIFVKVSESETVRFVFMADVYYLCT